MRVGIRKPELLTESVCCLDFMSVSITDPPLALRDYVSDDEGDPADARISPCTFLEFSDGARRWDADQPEKPEPEVCSSLYSQRQRALTIFKGYSASPYYP